MSTLIEELSKDADAVEIDKGFVVGVLQGIWVGVNQGFEALIIMVRNAGAAQYQVFEMMRKKFAVLLNGIPEEALFALGVGGSHEEVNADKREVVGRKAAKVA